MIKRQPLIATFYRHLFFAVAIFCFSLTKGLAQKNLFVAPNGNDKNVGTIQKPFATIAAAQQAVRKIKGRVNVFIRGGKYYLKRAVVFTTKDSRGENASVVYGPYKQEKVVISGAQPVALSWTRYRDNIYQAKVSGNLLFDQLFINGRLQQMARYPNYDSTARVFNGTAANALSVERTSGWKNPQGGFVHALHKSEWGGFHYEIKGKDAKGELVLEGGWQNNRQSTMHKNYRFVEGVFEELDTLKEWYFDRNEQTLYYYSGKETNLSTALVETPQLKHLFEFRGTEKSPVTNISIRGLQLTQTVRTFMETKEPLLRSDWTIYRGGVIVMDGTKNCTIKDCHIYNAGGNGIFFSNYNYGDTISGCHLENLGASAVCFVGDANAVRSPSFEYKEFVPLASLDKTKGPKTNNFPSHCVVYNNLIQNIGQVEKQVAGVHISMSKNITVSHNTIYNLPRSGININDGTWGGHIVEYNDVFNTVLETGDHGAFNSWGRDRYWHPVRDTMDKIVAAHRNELVLLDALETNIIRYNRFRCDHGWDIDLDDGSSNYHIYNNVLLNGGLKLREGFYRTDENNIIINNTFHPHVWFKNSEDMFSNNVVSTAYLPIRITQWGKLVDKNIFLDSAALAKEQKAGHDQHSVYEPVAFMNAAKGDYRLPQNSSAFTTGFKNFSTDSFGVVSQILKQLAQKVKLPQLIKFAVRKDEEIELIGMKVKSLTTLAERSATGMHAEKGVLVLEVLSSSALKDFIKPNDVLLMFNGKEINDVNALLQAKLALRSKSFPIKIFRNQKEEVVNVFLQ
ncbi:MAG: peptide-binding protein [Segetibacter sp.]|nr:peptide-binding protein [Segetibacter sp.]